MGFYVKNDKSRIRKISDPDIHLFIEKELRGGISYINKRYSKTSYKYCQDYDKEKPEIYIIYLDMKNLYGHAMSQYFPYEGFKMVKNNSTTINGILNKKDNSLQDYFVEKDLDYLEKFA